MAKTTNFVRVQKCSYTLGNPSEMLVSGGTIFLFVLIKNDEDFHEDKYFI